MLQSDPKMKTKKINKKNSIFDGNFSLDSQGVLHEKIKDHGKEFTAFIVLIYLQR